MNYKHCFIIPNFNGANFVGDIIQKCQLETNAKIIVVDDRSNDSSISVIEKYSVDLVKRQKNGGFAAAVNSGLKEAQRQGFTFATIMNSDVEIPKGFKNDLKIVLNMLEGNQKIAIAGYKENGTDRLFVDDKISGFFFTIRLDTIDVVGFLNEEFFMYGEETDFFRRILKNDFLIHQTGIELNHYSEKSNHGGIDNSWYSIRNSILLEIIHGNFLDVLKVILVLFLIINKLYNPIGWKNDPSINRIRRPGYLRGNYFLLKALLWNFKKIVMTRI